MRKVNVERSLRQIPLAPVSETHFGVSRGVCVWCCVCGCECVVVCSLVCVSESVSESVSASAQCECECECEFVCVSCVCASLCLCVLICVRVRVPSCECLHVWGKTQIATLVFHDSNVSNTRNTAHMFMLGIVSFDLVRKFWCLMRIALSLGLPWYRAARHTSTRCRPHRTTRTLSFQFSHTVPATSA